MIIVVSIHAPARGATRNEGGLLSEPSSFDPRSRTGSDVGQPQISRMPDAVSIHAPARGATASLVRKASPADVSIHAPARGATFIMMRPPAGRRRFQSTLPHGERPSAALPASAHRLVSIHAPARGATVPILASCDGSNVSIHAPARGATEARLLSRVQTAFQSTLPHGERRRGAPIVQGLARFQSTLPHGERHTQRSAWRESCCFNPRSRTGSDHR